MIKFEYINQDKSYRYVFKFDGERYPGEVEICVYKYYDRHVGWYDYYQIENEQVVWDGPGRFPDLKDRRVITPDAKNYLIRLIKLKAFW